jgi:NAD(P)H-flavin reductase
MYLWVCVAIWSFDRLISLCKLMVLNFGIMLGRLPKAQATYFADQDIIRILVRPSFLKKPSVGSYYFMYFPTMWRGWESHPFTLASYEVLQDDEPVTEVRDIYDKDGGDTSSTTPLISASEPRSKLSGNPLELSFLVRPQDGFTSQLKQTILKSGTTSALLTIFLEGPYGSTYPLSRYTNVLLIVGGSGIAAALPYVQEFVENSRWSSHSGKTQKLHLVWAARENSFSQAVLDNELQAVSTNDDIKLDIYITDSPMAAAADELEHGATRIQPGRPDIRDIVLQQASEPGSVAVFVCGPAEMEDQARRTVVEVVSSDSNKKIGFYEEAFGW